MTSTTTSYQSSRSTVPIVPAAVAAFVGTTALNALGIFADGTGGEHSTGEFLFIVGLTATAVAVVFGVVVPRTLRGTRSAGVGLGLAVAALVLLVPAFWSGLPAPLAIGGMLLGAAGRRSGRKAGVGGVAIAIGALVLVGLVAIYVLDWMATNNIAGM